MAQENNESVAYLMALKQSGSTPAAAAAAPAPEKIPGDQPASHVSGGKSGGVSGERYQGAEKRRSPRYQCQGSAEMRQDGCDVRTWATFTDISLHGCYVEAQVTYPVGTILQMKLEANGVRVETKGTVRVCYPYLGMGIALSEMSDENRARLKELLGTVSRPAVIMGPGLTASLRSPTCGPLDTVPPISDPAAAVQALVQFFETRHMLTRDDLSKDPSQESGQRYEGPHSGLTYRSLASLHPRNPSHSL